MESGGSTPHSQGLSKIPILSRINPTPRIDTYFLKSHSNIVFPSTLKPEEIVRENGKRGKWIRKFV